MNHRDTMLALLNNKKIKTVGGGYVYLGKDGYILDQNDKRANLTLSRMNERDKEMYCELLTAKERKYLSVIMADLGKKDFVRKTERIQNNGIFEQLQIVSHYQGEEYYSTLPCFVKGTKFRGLEPKRGYTKEDLQL